MQEPVLVDSEELAAFRHRAGQYGLAADGIQFQLEEIVAGLMTLLNVLPVVYDEEQPERPFPLEEVLRYAAIHTAQIGTDDADYDSWIIVLKMLSHLQRLIARKQELVASSELWAWYNVDNEAQTSESLSQGSKP